MRMIKFSLILIYAICCFIFLACREEIITPENIAGNLNEPVKMQTSTSYSFVVNADDISSNVIDGSPFNALRMSCYITIAGYTSGNVEIKVSGRSNVIIFNQIFASNIETLPLIFEGTSPEFIQFRFYNFTGKLRFELNKL